MKLVNAHFIGLKGIYSKSQIKEINIDFTRCNHKIIMIIGKNGYGKTTLSDALQPLPDPPSMYLDGEEGLKELVYSDQDELYKIEIRYPVTTKINPVTKTFERGQTKAFIYKIAPDNSMHDLNPNGNIGSFKEVLYSRFNLDPNFVTLSHLSIDNRGIVDKKPSERKTYIASQLDDTEAYNNIYKALNKRSSTYKSMTNSITAKIDSIGDEEKLKLDMQALVSRLGYLNSQKDEYSDKLSKAKATIELLDPNGAIQSKYNELIRQYRELTSKIESLELVLKSSNVSSEEEALSKFKAAEDTKNIINTEIQLEQSSIRTFLLDKEDQLHSIQTKQQRIAALSLDVDISKIKTAITETRKKIFQYEDNFKKIGLSNFEVSKDEYVSGLNTLNELRNMVIVLRSYASANSITDAVQAILTNRKDLIANTSDLKKVKAQIEDDLVTAKTSLHYYTGLLGRLDILTNRPDSCTIDTCVFIRDALEAKAQNPKAHIAELQDDIEKLSTELIDIDKRIEYITEVSKVTNDLSIIIRTIGNNKAILDKLPNGTMFSNTTEFLSRIEKGDTFNDIAELYKYLSYGNYLELYKTDCKVLKDLEKSYEINKEKESIVESLCDELSDMTTKLSNIEKSIEESNNKVLELQKQLESVEIKHHAYNVIIDRFKQLRIMKADLNDIKSQVSSVESDVAKISKATEEINIISGHLMNLNSEIAPKQQQLDQVKYSLVKLSEYREEMKVYEDKFRLADIIKKYSSPTKEGIQLLFMKLYMGPVIDMANRLLSMLFGGQLELIMDPEKNINKDEFRIPCINKLTSVVNDDISSCSGAERAMISMIISFALFYQSSTKYNIFSLDETDNTLDAENNSQFPVLINNILDIMGIEMCLMVSHSTEIDMSDVDIISLSPVSKEKLPGNVIFSLY